jgi:hypothetical protein
LFFGSIRLLSQQCWHNIHWRSVCWNIKSKKWMLQKK